MQSRVVCKITILFNSSNGHQKQNIVIKYTECEWLFLVSVVIDNLTPKYIIIYDRIIAEGFKDCLQIFRLSPSVFNNCWHLTIEAEKEFLSKFAWQQ
jgi:hypothetical protein